MAHTINVSGMYRHLTAPIIDGNYPSSPRPSEDNRYTVAPFTVWDKSPETFDTTTAATSDSQINAAAITAAANPSQDHLITVAVSTLTNTNGDIRFINIADFAAAGGSLTIRYTGAGYCEYDDSVLFTGTSGGIKFENFRFSRTVDGYINQELNLAANATIQPHSVGAVVFKNCQIGAYWGAYKGQYQRHPTAIFTRNGGSLKLDGCQLRDVASGFTNLGAGDVHIEKTFIDGNWVDKFYTSNNAAAPFRIWVHDCEGGYSYDGTASAIYTNEPFIVGETIHQDNTVAGGDLLVGVVDRIVEHGVDGCDSTTFRPGYTGKIVWINMDPVDGGNLVNNVAVVGQTSEASFTPTQTDHGGGSGDSDGGYVHTGYHNDIFQYGSANDNIGCSYEFYLDGLFVVAGSTTEADQGFFTDGGSKGSVKIRARQLHLGMNAANGFVTKTYDTDIDYVAMYQCPYGKPMPNKESINISWNSSKPLLRFKGAPKDTSETPSIGHVLTGSSDGGIYHEDQPAWPAMDVSKVIWADGTLESGFGSYPSVFSNFSGTWVDGQWIEDRPDRDSAMGVGDVKAWIRDNRQLAAAPWSDTGWVNPTRYNV